MYLGLSIENSVVNAAILTDGGDFVWQDSVALEQDKIASLLAVCSAITEQANTAHPGLSEKIAVSTEGGFTSQPSPPDGLKCLIGTDLKSNLQASLGRPIALASPGQALALYESRFGVAKNCAVACSLYLDSHVFGGVTFGETLWRGANRIVGAWGHMPLAWPVPHELDGRDCWCGRTGCIDCFLSLSGLEEEYYTITQTRLDIQAIAAAADASDLVAANVLQVLDDRIGRTTATIINMFDPDVIILGGRLANLDRLYQTVPRKWPGYLLVERSDTKLLRADPDAFTLAKGAACFAADPAAPPA